jgi:hypothetical protein
MADVKYRLCQSSVSRTSSRLPLFPSDESLGYFQSSASADAAEIRFCSVQGLPKSFMLRRIVQLNFRQVAGQTLQVVLGCALLLLIPAIAFGDEPQKNVLIFRSQDVNLPADSLVNQAIRSTLKATSTPRVQIYEEGLDYVRIPNEKFETEMVRFLQRKYEGVRLDLIFAISRPALTFLLKHKGEIFSDTPIVFVVIDKSGIAGLDLGSNTTGVSGRIEITPTLDLALALHPQIAHPRRGSRKS